MQLMNYTTDQKLLDAVSNMLIRQSHGSSPKGFYEYLFKVAKDGAELDRMLMNLGDYPTNITQNHQDQQKQKCRLFGLQVRQQQTSSMDRPNDCGWI